MIVGTIYVVIGVMLGLFLYSAIPLIGMILPEDLRTWLGRWFARRGAEFMRRMLLIKRENAGVKLTASRYNSDYRTERASLSGGKLEWKDENNDMGRLMGQPFGVVHEKLGVVVSPSKAAIGRRLRELTTQSELWRLVNGERRVKQHFTFSTEPKYEDVGDSLHWVQGSMPPTRPRSTVEIIKKAYENFNARQAMEIISIMIAFVMAILGVYMAKSLSAGGGGSMPSIPVPAMMDALTVIV